MQSIFMLSVLAPKNITTSVGNKTFIFFAPLQAQTMEKHVSYIFIYYRGRL